jgi:hypothetical protein
VLDQLDAAMDAIKKASWTDIRDLEGNPEALQRIEDAEQLLVALKSSLSPRDGNR